MEFPHGFGSFGRKIRNPDSEKPVLWVFRQSEVVQGSALIRPGASLIEVPPWLC